MIYLVGSVGSTSLAMIFPPIMHILTFSYDNSLSKTSLVMDIFIIVFGVLGAVSGIYSSFVDIVWNFQHHPGTLRSASLLNSTRTGF
jgi:proton-coupled amino acid transporter